MPTVQVKLMPGEQGGGGGGMEEPTKQSSDNVINHEK